MTEPRSADMETRAMPERSNRSTPTRERILGAATEVFSQNGYASSSIDDIAEAAGVTRATIYYHFASKESIYTSIVVAYATQWMDRLQSILNNADKSAAAKLAALIHDLIVTTLDRRTKRLHYDQYIQISESSRQVVREAQHAFADALAMVIDEAQSQDQAYPGDPKLLAMTIFESVGRIPVWWNPDGRVESDEAAWTLTAFFLRGLLTARGVSRVGDGFLPLSGASEQMGEV